MAARYFAPSATDINSTASWSTTEGGATGASVPTAGDDVYFWAGSPNVTAGLTALASIDLGSLTIGPSFTGNIGGAASPFQFLCTSGVVRVSSRGGFVNLSAASGTIADIRVESGAEVRLTGGTFTSVRGDKGRLTIESGAVVTNLYNNGASTTADYNATEFTVLSCTAGVVETIRGATTATVDVNGIIRQYRDASNTDTIVTLNIYGGRFLKQNSTPITTINMRTGVFDPTGATSNFTVSTLNLYGNNQTSKFYQTAGNVIVTVSTVNYFGTAGFQIKDSGGTGV